MNELNDLVSIIVPVYNISAYLPRCISSILKQDYSNIEVILVDDGSTDTSPEICDSWEKKDNRIKVIHKKNGGLSDARNAGIKRASGVYLVFVDGDDFIESDMISYLKKYSSQQSISVCRYTNNESYIEKINGNLNAIPQCLSYKEAVKFYFQDESYKFLYNRQLIYGSFMWNKLFPRIFFKNISFPVGSNYEDIAIILRLYSQADQVIFLSQKKYHYIEREDSIINKKNVVRKDYLIALDKQRKQLQEFGLYDDVKKEYITIYTYVLLQMMQEIRLCRNEDQYKNEFHQYCDAIRDIIKNKSISLPAKFYIKKYIIEYYPGIYRWIHYHK